MVTTASGCVFTVRFALSQRQVKLQTVCSLSGMSSGQNWLSIEYVTLPNIRQHQTDEINACVGVRTKKQEMKD
jgi:hypothetical protein